MYAEIVPMFSYLWWKCLGMVLAFPFPLIFLGSRVKQKYKTLISNILAAFLIFDAILIQIKTIALGTWNVTWVLPLQFCNVMAIIASVALITRRQGSYEIGLFLGMITPCFAFITPALVYPAEGFFLFEYYADHAVTVVTPIFLTVVMKMRPRPGAWWKMPLKFGFFLIPLYLFNWMVGANYMFLLNSTTQENKGKWKNQNHS